MTMQKEWLRPAIRYPDGYKLSVQASEYHYSTPRVTGLDIDEYEHVEIAIINPSGALVHPTEAGLSQELEALFDASDAPVAGYVDQQVAACIRRDMERLHA